MASPTLKSNDWVQKICKKKNLSWLFGEDRKIRPSGSLFGITRQSLVMPNSDPRTDFSVRTSHPWKILIIMGGWTGGGDTESEGTGRAGRRTRREGAGNLSSSTNMYCKSWFQFLCTPLNVQCVSLICSLICLCTFSVANSCLLIAFLLRFSCFSYSVPSVAYLRFN